MSFTPVIFPFSPTIPSGVDNFPFQAPLPVLLQNGVVANVPADGSSSVSVTYPSAFANSIIAVLSAEGNSTWSGYALSTQIFNVTQTGFSVSVSGGPSGLTTSVSWIASGT